MTHFCVLLEKEELVSPFSLLRLHVFCRFRSPDWFTSSGVSFKGRCIIYQEVFLSCKARLRSLVQNFLRLKSSSSSFWKTKSLRRARLGNTNDERKYSKMERVGVWAWVGERERDVVTCECVCAHIRSVWLSVRVCAQERESASLVIVLDVNP